MAKLRKIKEVTNNASISSKNATAGITLVALVITIIVLLILAGITIAALTGENGILSKATQSVKETDIAEIKEKIKLDILAQQTGNQGKAISESQLKSILEKYATINYEADNTTIKSITTQKGNEIAIKDIWNGIEGEESLYIGGEYNQEKGCNTPIVAGTGLIPVKMNEATGEVTDVVNPQTDGSWYNYANKQWANARTADGSMWVWIPRYAYQITSQYHTGGTGSGTIEVEFLKGTTNEYGNKAGTAPTTYPTVSVGTMNDYVLHPAFGTDLNQGGWRKDLAGFWVAKYEAGFDTSYTVSNADTGLKYADVYNNVLNYYTVNKASSGVTATANYIEANSTQILYPVFKANKYSYNYIATGDTFNLTRALTKTNNPYKLESTKIDSHLVKNSEWGAVAYLSTSKYGKGSNDGITINSTNKNDTTNGVYAITAGGNGTNALEADEKVAIKNNEAQSSTGNITGIYDLFGGTYERTAGFILNPNGASIRASYGGSFATGEQDEYRTIYAYDNADTREANYAKLDPVNAKATFKYGDAIWETSQNGNNSSPYSWKSGYSSFAYSNVPFWIRSGYYGDSIGGGLFYFVNTGGSVNNRCGFRAVLCPI